MRSIEELENKLSEPSDRLLKDIGDLEGDILILGAAGKMGPSLAHMAQRAVEKAGSSSKVIGVSRYSNSDHQKKLVDWGVSTIREDLMNDKELQALHDATNVISHCDI